MLNFKRSILLSILLCIGVSQSVNAWHIPFFKSRNIGLAACGAAVVYFALYWFKATKKSAQVFRPSQIDEMRNLLSDDRFLFNINPLTIENLKYLAREGSLHSYDDQDTSFGQISYEDENSFLVKILAEARKQKDFLNNKKSLLSSFRNSLLDSDRRKTISLESDLGSWIVKNENLIANLETRLDPLNPGD